MFKPLLVSCLLLISGNSFLGQQVSQEHPRQRAEFTLVQLPDQIKTIDNPTMRGVLRLRLAAFLWEKRAKNTEARATAEALASEALADSKAHEAELPYLYKGSVQKELLALIKLHAPNLAARFAKLYEPAQDKNDDQLSIASSMLRNKDGAGAAVEIFRRRLNNGQDMGDMILFFLGQLERQQSLELPKLLIAILDTEERKPGSVSVESLFSIARLYFKDETPPELKARYFSTVVNTIELNYIGFNDEWTQYAYRLMNNMLPRIEILAPSLYIRGRELMSVLTGRVPQRVIDQVAMRARISQSEDPLNQLMVEANASKDEGAKSGLLIEAAQMALSKGQVKRAADLLPESAPDDYGGLYHDQFLGDVASSALREKAPDIAEYATSKIKSKLKRASVKQKIAEYFFESKDLVQAREQLNEAVKLAASVDNSSEKAISLLGLTESYIKIDEVRVMEMAQAAIKIINNIPQPKLEEKPDSAVRKAYAESLAKMAVNLIPVFQRLAQIDEVGASILAKELQSREMKFSATFGAATGILAANESAKAEATK